MSLGSQGKAQAITAIGNLTAQEVVDIQQFLSSSKKVPLPATITNIKALLNSAWNGSTIADTDILSATSDLLALIAVKKMQSKNIISLTDTTWSIVS